MKFIIATKNAHKLEELARILNPLGIEAISEAGLDVPLSEVEETGETFEENAYLKAKAACEQTGLPAIADDSGLCVDSLKGAPGVYSARYAGEGASDLDRIHKLLKELEGVPEKERQAKFVSAVCCVLPGGQVLTVRGECKGSIAFAPAGTGGFGYDPVFLVGQKSFGQLSKEEKDAVSHRGQALRLLAQKLPAFLEENI